MGSGSQVKNGKAFEYAIAVAYADYLQTIGMTVNTVSDKHYLAAQTYFSGFSEDCQTRFLLAAKSTIKTISLLEPGLTVPGKDNSFNVRINGDFSGEEGDVRDIVISRPEFNWELGFSAKNNNDAMKHSRLSQVLDFGKSWVGVSCSNEYWDEIRPIFGYLKECKNRKLQWSDLTDKEENVYIPLLNAFRRELLNIYSCNDDIPQRLIRYLIGTSPFYKIIKDDSHNLAVVKAFNIEGKLNKTINGRKPEYKTPKINLPTQIIKLDFKQGSNNTLDMVMDGGWEVSFRIHNASSSVEPSLKFDIQLLGNPPVLFSQYLFQFEYPV